MAKVVIHIGTHKTGTTTIQHVFARNRERLRDVKIIYPEVGPQAGHHGLIAPWLGLPEVFHVGDPDQLWQDLAQQYANEDGTLFLSSEEFSRGTKNRRVNFGHVRKMLSGFESVALLCTIRDQPSFLQSIFLEISKKGNEPPPWTKFLSKALTSHLATGLHLDYNNLYDQLLADFAAEEINFVSYNDACKHPDGIVGDMLARIGAAIPTDELKGNVSANVSPEPLAGWMAAAIAVKQGAPKLAIEAAMTALNAVHRDGLKTMIYTRQELEQVISKYQEANVAFAQRIRQTNPDFHFPACRLGDDRLSRDQLNEAVWLRFASELYYRPLAEQARIQAEAEAQSQAEAEAQSPG